MNEQIWFQSGFSRKFFVACLTIERLFQRTSSRKHSYTGILSLQLRAHFWNIAFLNEFERVKGKIGNLILYLSNIWVFVNNIYVFFFHLLNFSKKYFLFVWKLKLTLIISCQFYYSFTTFLLIQVAIF